MTRAFIILAALFVGCGQSSQSGSSGGSDSSTSGNTSGIDPSAIIVKSKALIEITTNSSPSIRQSSLSYFSISALDFSQTIVVTNGASSILTVDNSLFRIPTISNAFLDFGYLQISSLFDNNLNVCGSNSNQHCGTGIIRMYTTGTAGSGIYNSIDNFGAPIVAGQTILSSIGLNSSNAAIMQSISIPSAKHVVTLSDFANPKYGIKADFTNAGAGSYSTTLVLEYGLAP